MKEPAAEGMGARLELPVERTADPVAHTYRGLERRQRRFVETLVLPHVGDRERALKVLDIGCATGEAVFHLAAELPAARFTGVDVSTENVAIAERERAASRAAARVRFVATDYAAFAPGELYDVIVSESCLQYVPGPHEKLFGKILGELAPGGLLALSIPVDSFHTRVVCGFRRALNVVRCRFTDWLGIKVARLFHPTFSDAELWQRAFYVFYLAPCRLDDLRLRRFLASSGLELLHEETPRVLSFFQLRHRLSVYRKRS